MPEEKVDSAWSLKTIKKKVRDWWVTYDERLWAKRVLLYFTAFGLWTGVF